MVNLKNAWKCSWKVGEWAVPAVNSRVIAEKERALGTDEDTRVKTT